MACPYDTDGDGNCGRRYCPHCGSFEAFKTVLHSMCASKMMESVEAQFIADADDPAPVIVETK